MHIKIDEKYFDGLNDCSIVHLTSFDGRPAVEINTSFSFSDGTAIAVYAVEYEDYFLLSDNRDTIAHAFSLGLDFSKNLIFFFNINWDEAGIKISKELDITGIFAKEKLCIGVAFLTASILEVGKILQKQICSGPIDNIEGGCHYEFLTSLKEVCDGILKDKV